MIPRRRSPIQMGTVIQRALSAIGVTEERVSSVFGGCKCKNRAAKLNQLSDWAYRFLTRQKADEPDIMEKGKKELDDLMSKR